MLRTMNETNTLLMDVLVKLSTIESLLVSKGIITKEEYSDRLIEISNFLSISALKSSGMSDEDVQKFVKEFFNK